MSATRGQADDPLRGREALLNGWGYFLAFGDDRAFRPEFLNDEDRVVSRARWRLMEFSQPTERLRIYEDSLAHSRGDRDDFYRWFGDDLDRFSRPIADNIVVLVMRPRLDSKSTDAASGTEIAPEYLYDSKELSWAGESPRTQASLNQLPPLVEITMVAISEASAVQYESRFGEGSLEILVPRSLFQESAKLEEDLGILESFLAEQGINFQTFSTTVTLRGARWSL